MNTIYLEVNQVPSQLLGGYRGKKFAARAARLLPADSVAGRLNRAGELRRAGDYAAARDELRAVRDWPGEDCGA